MNAHDGHKNVLNSASDVAITVKFISGLNIFFNFFESTYLNKIISQSTVDDFGYRLAIKVILVG